MSGPGKLSLQLAASPNRTSAARGPATALSEIIPVKSPLPQPAPSRPAAPLRSDPPKFAGRRHSANSISHRLNHLPCSTTRHPPSLGLSSYQRPAFSPIAWNSPAPTKPSRNSRPPGPRATHRLPYEPNSRRSGAPARIPRPSRIKTRIRRPKSRPRPTQGLPHEPNSRRPGTRARSPRTPRCKAKSRRRPRSIRLLKPPVINQTGTRRPPGRSARPPSDPGPPKPNRAALVGLRQRAPPPEAACCGAPPARRGAPPPHMRRSKQ
jgi:hypothetical protein